MHAQIIILCVIASDWNTYEISNKHNDYKSRMQNSPKPWKPCTLALEGIIKIFCLARWSTAHLAISLFLFPYMKTLIWSFLSSQTSKSIPVLHIQCHLTLPLCLAYSFSRNCIFQSLQIAHELHTTMLK